MAAIDILMPMRDAAPWVADAWKSLARQTLGDWRLLVVDDGSTDDCAARLLEAAGGDPRVRLTPQPATGVAAALNRALRQVSAPVVVRMDADDVCHPRRLEILWSGLRARPETGALGSRVRMFPRRRVSPAMEAYVAWQNSLLSRRAIRAERYVECTVTHASTAFRTRVLEDVGGWWEGEGPEDLDLFLRLHAAGVIIRKSPQVLYRWRESSDRETRSSSRMQPEAFRRTKARHLARELERRGEPRVWLFGRGRSLLAWEETLKRQCGVEVEAAEYRPGARLPPWEGLAVFCFGHPKARTRVRSQLKGVREDGDYLFVS